MALSQKQEQMCSESKWDFSDLKAMFLNCTLKKSPEQSHRPWPQLTKSHTTSAKGSALGLIVYLWLAARSKASMHSFAPPRNAMEIDFHARLCIAWHETTAAISPTSCLMQRTPALSADSCREPMIRLVRKSNMCWVMSTRTRCRMSSYVAPISAP